MIRALLTAAFFFSVTPICEAQTRAAGKGRIDDYVTFYSMPGFRGDSFSVESAGEISNLGSRRLDFFTGLSSFSSQRRGDWDNTISSIAFNGAFEVTLFADKNFEGASKSFVVSAVHLGSGRRATFDNQASSLRWQPLQDGQGQPRVIFYNRDGFQGNSFVLYPGDSISKLQKKRRTSRSKHWEDEIRSIRVVGDEVTLKLYQDREYKSKRVTIRSDASSLLPIGFSAIASSVRINGRR